MRSNGSQGKPLSTETVSLFPAECRFHLRMPYETALGGGLRGNLLVFLRKTGHPAVSGLHCGDKMCHEWWTCDLNMEATAR